MAILRFREVRRRTGLSPSEVRRRERLGLFPQRVPLGPRAVGWVEQEIEQWVEGRIRQRRN